MHLKIFPSYSATLTRPTTDEKSFLFEDFQEKTLSFFLAIFWWYFGATFWKTVVGLSYAAHKYSITTTMTWFDWRLFIFDIEKLYTIECYITHWNFFSELKRGSYSIIFCDCKNRTAPSGSYNDDTNNVIIQGQNWGARKNFVVLKTITRKFSFKREDLLNEFSFRNFPQWEGGYQ